MNSFYPEHGVPPVWKKLFAGMPEGTWNDLYESERSLPDSYIENIYLNEIRYGAEYPLIESLIDEQIRIWTNPVLSGWDIRFVDKTVKPDGGKLGSKYASFDIGGSSVYPMPQLVDTADNEDCHNIFLKLKVSNLWDQAVWVWTMIEEKFAAAGVEENSYPITHFSIDSRLLFPICLAVLIRHRIGLTLETPMLFGKDNFFTQEDYDWLTALYARHIGKVHPEDKERLTEWN
jgi:hypothetical protein